MPSAPVRDLLSDTSAGADPEVMRAWLEAAAGHHPAYGQDAWTDRLTERVGQLLGVRAGVHLTFGGTGANMAALLTALAPGRSVLCAQEAHLAADEAGGPERLTGAKLVPLPVQHGKVAPSAVHAAVQQARAGTAAPAGVLSLAQATEVGTLYSAAELAELVEVAHGYGLRVHVDGARLANAVVGLGACDLVWLADTGVDVVTFGGTKNGLPVGELLLVLDPVAAEVSAQLVRQAGQLPAKQRFLAAGFLALLEQDRWLHNASRANEMAGRLARAAQAAGVRLAHPVQANAVFADLAEPAAKQLASWSPFHCWGPGRGPGRTLVRWMCSFDTTEQDVDDFAAGLTAVLASG